MVITMVSHSRRRKTIKDNSWLVDVEKTELKPCLIAKIQAENADIERRRRSYGIY